MFEMKTRARFNIQGLKKFYVSVENLLREYGEIEVEITLPDPSPFRRIALESGFSPSFPPEPERKRSPPVTEEDFNTIVASGGTENPGGKYKRTTINKCLAAGTWKKFCDNKKKFQDARNRINKRMNGHAHK